MKNWIALVKTAKGIFIVLDDSNEAILGFVDQADGLRYYEDAYHRAHGRSYEGSMSACINWMAYQPSIVELTDEEISGLLERDEEGHTYACSLWHTSGGMTGVKCNDSAEAVWERGAKPKLWDEDRHLKDELDQAEEFLRRHGRL